LPARIIQVELLGAGGERGGGGGGVGEGVISFSSAPAVFNSFKHILRHSLAGV